MLIPVYQNTFEKDVRKAKKRGLDISKLKRIMELLVGEKSLEPKHRNHTLKGNFVGYWECHIEPDWLLVYKKTKTHTIYQK